MASDEAPDGRRGITWSLARVRRDQTLRRESDMMAFTVCIALLAALSYGDDDAAHSHLDVLAIVWGTTVGLALTHWFALTLSVWLVRDLHLQRTLEMLVAHLAMAFLVAIVATMVVLPLSEDFDRLGARLAAALFLGVLVGVESRAGGSSARRSIGLAGVALAIGLAIATLKWVLST